jgi:hypothetical protein
MNHESRMLTVDVTPTESLKNVTPMTAEEARAAVTEVNMRIDSVRQKLAELHRREGWKALGYSSWKQFSEVEFKRNRSRLYQVLNAAEVESCLLAGGVELSKILDSPESHIRVIAKAPVTKRVEAFSLLKTWEKNGKVTEREAEAAVAAVYPNFAYRKIEALCLPLIENGIKIPEHNAAKTVFKYWKDKGEPVPKVLSEVLRDGIEDFLEDIPQSEETVSDNHSTDPGLSEALEIASYLNSCEPEAVARAFTLMAEAEDYQVIMMLRIIPRLDKETVSKVLKDEGIETNDIQAFADSCFSLCQHLDTAFDLPS